MLEKASHCFKRLSARNKLLSQDYQIQVHGSETITCPSRTLSHNLYSLMNGEDENHAINTTQSKSKTVLKFSDD